MIPAILKFEDLFEATIFTLQSYQYIPTKHLIGRKYTWGIWIQGIFRAFIESNISGTLIFLYAFFFNISSFAKQHSLALLNLEVFIQPIGTEKQKSIKFNVTVWKNRLFPRTLKFYLRSLLCLILCNHSWFDGRLKWYSTNHCFISLSHC